MLAKTEVVKTLSRLSLIGLVATIALTYDFFLLLDWGDWLILAKDWALITLTFSGFALLFSLQRRRACKENILKQIAAAELAAKLGTSPSELRQASLGGILIVARVHDTNKRFIVTGDTSVFEETDKLVNIGHGNS